MFQGVSHCINSILGTKLTVLGRLTLPVPLVSVYHRMYQIVKFWVEKESATFRITFFRGVFQWG